MVIQSVENAEPLYPPQSNAIFRGQTSARNSFPVEIWEEIFKWLPRSDIKNLLPVPHPIIHAVSSELYWSTCGSTFLTKGWKWKIYKFGISKGHCKLTGFLCAVGTLDVF